MSNRSPQLVQGSIFDRLIDGETDHAGAQSVDHYRRTVQRDLENLLNARRSWWAADSQAPIATSSLGYGLPDFLAALFHHPDAQEALQLSIEETIRRFEPRLSSVRVSVLTRQSAPRRTLHLRIEAVLRVEKMNENILFDTIIDPTAAGVRLQLAEDDAA